MRTCLLIVPATLLLLGAAACGSPAYPSSASPTGVASASGSAASAWVTATPTPSPSPPTPATSSPGTATAAAPPTPARAPAPPKGRPLAGIVVVVDPGHDGGNAAHPQISQRLVNAVTMMKPCDSTGTQDGTGYPEHLFTWQLGQILAADLKALGATVVLTRHSDTGVGPCMTVRSAIANAAHADAVLTLHDYSDRETAEAVKCDLRWTMRGSTPRRWCTGGVEGPTRIGRTGSTTRSGP